MTLKELRISKHLNQSQCADLTGVSLRTYQNYEKDSKLVGTVRYNSIYKTIEQYGTMTKTQLIAPNNDVFFTNVKKDDSLIPLCKVVSSYKKRDCFQHLSNFINGNYDGRVCILYGLRRTGKTTLLLQMIKGLPFDKTAYIKVQNSNTMSNLTKDLEKLNKFGYRYIFIDEITLLEDFINTAAVLSDIFSMMGMKIVLSGTDSLSFAMADRDELYDRNVMIHTSFIPFKEYSRLLDIHSIDTYIEYGGTLKKENMSFDDEDLRSDEVSFRDDESTRKYIDTAISRNIQNSLKNNYFGAYFNALQELYDKGELTNVINRIVEDMNHRFLLSVVEREFKSHDLGSAKNNLLHDIPAPRAHVLDDVDTKQIVERLKAIIDVKEKQELTVPITQAHIDTIKKYLRMLDLIYNCPYQVENIGMQDHFIFTQPGMRYAIAKALVYSLMQDAYFNSISEQDKSYIIQKILSDVKGRMLEDIVLLETVKKIPSTKKAFQFRFTEGGEFDMVVYDSKTNTCAIYEVKHSEKVVKDQTKHLTNAEKCATIEHIYGQITGRYVIYRGENYKVGDVNYINVEEYLMNL